MHILIHAKLLNDREAGEFTADTNELAFQWRVPHRPLRALAKWLLFRTLAIKREEGIDTDDNTQIVVR